MFGLRDSEACNCHWTLESCHNGNVFTSPLSKKILHIGLQSDNFPILRREGESGDIEKFVNDDSPAASFKDIFQCFVKFLGACLLVSVWVEFEAIVLGGFQGLCARYRSFRSPFHFVWLRAEYYLVLPLSD